MITFMGLAVGIDYSLFIVSRYREERAAGRQAAARSNVGRLTASRAVLFSGMTVVLALVGMLIVPTKIFISLAVGAILVVLVAVIAALTLLPAVLRLLGDRVNRLRVPFLGRRATGGRPRRTGFWARAVASGHAPPASARSSPRSRCCWSPRSPYLNINTGAAGVVHAARQPAARSRASSS